MEEGLQWLDDRFHVIRYEDDELPSVDWVLDLARAAVLRWRLHPSHASAKRPWCTSLSFLLAAAPLLLCS